MKEHKPGYFPGSSPGSEPEILALEKLIESTKATRLVALHSPYRMVNWDGTGELLAQAMSDLNGYELVASMGYPTPGSFGSKYGVDQDCEVITLEIPFMSPHQAWMDNRAALRYVVDLPA